MKLRKTNIAITIVILVLLIFTGTIMAQESTEKQQVKEEQLDLIVIANRETYKLAEGVIQFMEGRGVPVLHVTASEFKEKPDYRKEKYIVILGGPNESNGIGSITKEVLSQEEQEWVSKVGNKKMYLKVDKWCKGQYILVFAGYDRDATYRALINSKDKWWGYISSWFDIELTHEELYGY